MWRVWTRALPGVQVHAKACSPGGCHCIWNLLTDTRQQVGAEQIKLSWSLMVQRGHQKRKQAVTE